MKKILLVEDDASLCRGISFKLKKEGYEVLTSPTVKDAIVIFENKKMEMDMNFAKKLDKIVTCFLYSLLHWIKK